MNAATDPNQIFADARTAHEAGDAPKAEALYKQLLDIAPGHPDVLHLLGVLYGQIGQFDDALMAIGEAIEKVPTDSSYHYNLGNVFVQMKRWGDAGAAFGKSLKLTPQNTDAAFNLGLSLKQAGQIDEAEKAFRHVVSLNSNHAEALSELSETLGERGELDEAISFQERAISLNPEIANFHFNLGMLQLKSRNWAQAQACFDATLTRQRWHVPALAGQAIALHENGEDENANALLDLENLIEIQKLTFPADLQPRELGDKLATHSSCVWERSDTTTRVGAQTGNLAHDTDPTIRRFVTALTAQIEGFVSTKKTDNAHPFTAQIPEKWEYSIWATILDEDGHQNPHLHPAAWVSGVFYLEVPDVITSPDNVAQSGWIEFGAPGYGVTSVRAPNVRRIMPEPGKLIFFPSYFFHQTVPLSGDARRISIAFDVIPIKWRN